MADPTKYNESFDFSDFQASSPASPLPGDRLDTELHNLKRTTDETIDAMKDIRRSDGALKNGSVGVDQLSSSLSMGFTLRGDWVAGTRYLAADGAVLDGKFYKAKVAHVAREDNRPDNDAGTWSFLLSMSTIGVADGSITAAKLDATDAANIREVVGQAALVSEAVNGVASAAFPSTATLLARKADGSLLKRSVSEFSKETFGAFGLGTDAPALANLDAYKGTGFFNFIDTAVGAPASGGGSYDAVGLQIGFAGQRTQITSISSNAAAGEVLLVRIEDGANNSGAWSGWFSILDKATALTLFFALGDAATAAQIRAGAAGKVLTSGTTNAAMDWVPLAYAATMTMDHRDGTNRAVTLTGNGAFAAPTNLIPGLPLVVAVKQDATGNRVPTWNAAFNFGDYGVPKLSTGANQEDMLTFIVRSTSKLAFMGIRKRTE